jgi:hypothetical protein
MSLSGKYLPLAAYLADAVAAQDRVRLTFAQLEAMVGPLPRQASVPLFWRSSRTARLNWLFDGFTGYLHPTDQAVTFMRAAARRMAS